MSIFRGSTLLTPDAIDCRADNPNQSVSYQVPIGAIAITTEGNFVNITTSANTVLTTSGTSVGSPVLTDTSSWVELGGGTTSSGLDISGLSDNTIPIVNQGAGTFGTAVTNTVAASINSSLGLLRVIFDAADVTAMGLDTDTTLVQMALTVSGFGTTTRTYNLAGTFSGATYTITDQTTVDNGGANVTISDYLALYGGTIAIGAVTVAIGTLGANSFADSVLTQVTTSDEGTTFNAVTITSGGEAGPNNSLNVNGTTIDSTGAISGVTVGTQQAVVDLSTLAGEVPLVFHGGNFRPINLGTANQFISVNDNGNGLIWTDAPLEAVSEAPGATVVISTFTDGATASSNSATQTFTITDPSTPLAMVDDTVVFSDGIQVGTPGFGGSVLFGANGVTGTVTSVIGNEITISTSVAVASTSGQISGGSVTISRAGDPVVTVDGDLTVTGTLTGDGSSLTGIGAGAFYDTGTGGTSSFVWEESDGTVVSAFQADLVYTRAGDTVTVGGTVVFNSGSDTDIYIDFNTLPYAVDTVRRLYFGTWSSNDTVVRESGIISAHGMTADQQDTVDPVFTGSSFRPNTQNQTIRFMFTYITNQGADTENLRNNWVTTA